MNTYLVGGAVRDALLGLPVKDRDWVVVGATPEAMAEAGYRPVGRDFPVFLHPETHEEHALARTERKSGPGYRGFVFDTDPSVTLEEDLSRRDLTINAIARRGNGELVDPYGGVRDVERRVLRHVSDAFVEDPVRVLRVARFAARLAPFGFRVAEETRALMRRMVADGEVAHLVAERVWQELEGALGAAARGRSSRRSATRTRSASCCPRSTRWRASLSPPRATPAPTPTSTPCSRSMRPPRSTTIRRRVSPPSVTTSARARRHRSISRTTPTTRRAARRSSVRSPSA